MNNCSSNYSTRLRSRTKQPVYTSDKRAKFTQRENKKWIRFVTVLGYIFFVSLPAVSLSIYYVYIWDPGYINKFPSEIINTSSPVHVSPIVSTRLERDTSHSASNENDSHLKSTTTEPCVSCTHDYVDLATILAEGLNSMETSVESSPTITIEPDLRVKA
ncbi:hypothetical protein RB195_013001 [Necator americanus]